MSDIDRVRSRAGCVRYPCGAPDQGDQRSEQDGTYPGTRQRGGWIARERDPPDRGACAPAANAAELILLYGGMNSAVDDLCASFSEAESAVIADFVQRTANAGQRAADDLAGD